LDTIPVTKSAKEALYLPLGYFRQLFRFAFVPILIIGAAQALGGVITVATGRKVFYGLWWLPYGILVIPFSVSWARLAILGVGGNLGRRWSTFGAREVKYLSISLAISFLLFGPAAVCFYFAYLKDWASLPFIVGLAFLMLGLVIGTRFFFLLPAIAVDSYRGLKSVWQQSHSVVLRIMAVVLLSSLPINCGESILRRVEASVKDVPLIVLVLGFGDVLLLFVSAAVTTGAVALCYRIRVE
jgi:hypothetical protein